MNELHLKIALAYKVPRITKFIEEDLKQIKKLNQVLIRLERNDKEQYILESVNILRQLDNVFNLDLLYPVLCELIDIRFHTTILFLYDKLANPSATYIRKLQELSEDEE